MGKMKVLKVTLQSDDAAVNASKLKLVLGEQYRIVKADERYNRSRSWYKYVGQSAVDGRHMFAVEDYDDDDFKGMTLYCGEVTFKITECEFLHTANGKLMYHYSSMEDCWFDAAKERIIQNQGMLILVGLFMTALLFAMGTWLFFSLFWSALILAGYVLLDLFFLNPAWDVVHREEEMYKAMLDKKVKEGRDK